MLSIGIPFAGNRIDTRHVSVAHNVLNDPRPSCKPRPRRELRSGEPGRPGLRCSPTIFLPTSNLRTLEPTSYVFTFTTYTGQCDDVSGGDLAGPPEGQRK